MENGEIYLVFDFQTVERKLNSYTREWRTIQSGSLKTVNSILGLISKLNLVKNKQFYEALDFPDLENRMVLALIDQINLKIPNMIKATGAFRNLLEKMTNWAAVYNRLITSEIRNLVDSNRLQELDSSQKDEIESKIRIREQTLDHILEITKMFETEVQLRIRLIELLQKSTNQLNAQLISFYLTIWASEPYIDFNRILEILESFQSLDFVSQSANQSADIRN